MTNDNTTADDDSIDPDHRLAGAIPEGRHVEAEPETQPAPAPFDSGGGLALRVADVDGCELQAFVEIENADGESVDVVSDVDECGNERLYHLDVTPNDELRALAESFEDAADEWASEGVEDDGIWGRAVTYRRSARRLRGLITDAE